MESERPFGNEMPNFDICRTAFKELFKDIDVLDVDAKTETAASSENSWRKSTENEQLWEAQMMQCLDYWSFINAAWVCFETWLDSFYQK